jgi:acyl-CoA hydrolase
MVTNRLFVLALWLFMLAACSKAPAPVQPLRVGAVVVVIGDSLVAGTGARPDEAWPSALGRSTGWSVVNAGVPGDTSAAALLRLPDLLERHRPDAVIIAVGGNDFLRNVQLAHTRENLEALVQTSKVAAGHVALMGVPRVSMAGAAFGALSDHELFEEIAGEHDVLLVPGAIADTLSRAQLRSDRIHANGEGYAFMAAQVYDVLVRHGWADAGKGR